MKDISINLSKKRNKNMEVMSIKSYSRLIDETEFALDEADRYAEMNSKRLMHDEVFSSIREKLHA